jgi:hypothetical protein
MCLYYNFDLEESIMEFIKGGAKIIQEMIDNANGTATVTGNYEIEATVYIPSAFHLVLENCHLKMADGTFCNMFKNEGFEEKRPNENIVIEGRGNAILDGGNHNGLYERDSLKNGNPSIYVNNLLHFANVKGFKVTGLHARNQRYWALCFTGCSNGYIGNIDFLGDAVWIDDEGGEHFGLIREVGHAKARRQNADGIDLRRGCHDIIIENITGFTEDDTVAITSLPVKEGGPSDFLTPGASTDIYNVIVRNVAASAFCSIVRLLCQGGGKLYNIIVDGVIDTSLNSPYMDIGSYAVRIGDVLEYRSPQPSEDEMYNITARNVIGRSEVAVDVAQVKGKVFVDNVQGYDTCKIPVRYR